MFAGKYVDDWIFHYCTRTIVFPAPSINFYLADDEQVTSISDYSMCEEMQLQSRVNISSCKPIIM